MLRRMSDGLLFRDRREAGRLLADELRPRIGAEPVLIVALPRGGVPVGYEVAGALDAPLDIALVRKLGAPGQPELGVGAIGEDGTVVLDDHTVAAVGMSGDQVELIAQRELAELERRRELYRQAAPLQEVDGRRVILVDDGSATGVTASAAGKVLRARGAGELIAAFPVAAPGVDERLGDDFDRVICLETPAGFRGVGGFYREFGQTTDDEVLDLLRSATGGGPGGAASPGD